MTVAKKPKAVAKGIRKGDAKILNPGSAIPNSKNSNEYSVDFMRGYKQAKLDSATKKMSRKQLSTVASQKVASAQQTSAKDRLGVYTGKPTLNGRMPGAPAGRKVSQAAQMYAASNRRSSKRKRGD